MPSPIFFIDDNQADVDLLGLAMEEAGAVEVLGTETDPAKALRRLEAMPDAELPRLVLLDLNMPRLNGKDVLRAIKSNARLARLKVVMFTTSSRPGDVDECRRLGADDYVVKPADFEQLVRLARRFVAEVAAA